MSAHEKMTVPLPPAPTDGEQSFLNGSTSTITQFDEKCNSDFSGTASDCPEEDCEKLLRRMQDPAYLPTMSMQELYSTSFAGRPPIIDGLLHTGAYLLVGAPKVGKSFLVAQIAYHVSTGQPLWGYPVKQGTVLYLALEDDYQRLQSRLFRMFGSDTAEKLHFATASKQLGKGLTEQLNQFLRQHPDTKLVIIDTLQRVRESTESYSYSSDYEATGQLKRLADANNICLLIVHHTRKQLADDKFEMVSGTNGLLGAADGGMVLYKQKRTDADAVLDIVGRDQQDQRLYLERNQETLAWELTKTETELWEEPKDPLLEKLDTFLTYDKPSWSGSATELKELLGFEEAANALTYHLNVRQSLLMEQHHIRYLNQHTRSGSRITLIREPEDQPLLREA